MGFPLGSHVDSPPRALDGLQDFFEGFSRDGGLITLPLGQQGIHLQRVAVKVSESQMVWTQMGLQQFSIESYS